MAETDVTQQSDDDFDDTGADKATESTGKTFRQEDVDRIVADRIAREKAKYADYSDLKRRAAAAMSDQEKALAEAEQRGRSAAQQASGVRLARAELRAAAAGQVTPEALDGFLEYADLSRFIGEDGEPNEKAIKSAITKLGAGSTKTTSSTNYDGGARDSAARPTDMNALIRRGAGHEA